MGEKLVDVSRVSQENDYYCGPATAQMILSALGVPAPAGPTSWQDQLWEDIQSETHYHRQKKAPQTPEPVFDTQKCEPGADSCLHCWATWPPALRAVLNSHQEKAKYSATKHDNEKDATAEILNTIDVGLPAAALVYGCQHWLVVEGYVFGTGDEGEEDVGGTALDGVYLRDPWQGAEDTRLVAWEAWRDGYLQCMPIGTSSTYLEHMVVIGARLKKSTASKAKKSALSPKAQIGAASAATNGSGETHDGSPGAALEAAAKAAKRLLASAPRLRPALEGAVPGRPLRVRRLDVENRDYYIVSFHRQAGAAGDSARLIVNATTGSFGEAAATLGRKAVLPPFIDPMKALPGLRPAPGRGRAVPAVRRLDASAVAPELVWKPCRESPSPFVPFYTVTVGGRLLYLKADGRGWFSSLTVAAA
jgi:hypothetical protein